MNTNIVYEVTSDTFKYLDRTVCITENDTCYLFTDQESGILVHYINYDQLFNLVALNSELSRDILRMALKSEGKQNVPTSILLPLASTDTFVHDRTFSNLSSLRQLSCWVKFISNNMHGTYELGSKAFTPFEPLQIGKVFESINVNSFSDEAQKVFDDSLELFDFENNLSKISWFSTALAKYGTILPNIESENINLFNHISPGDAFTLVNEIMAYIFVYEAAKHPMEQIVASNIIFIHFLQDTGSGTNAYRPLLPVMQAAVMYTLMPAIVPSNMSTFLKSKVKYLIEKSKLNKNNNRRGWYKLYMKLKNVQQRCNKSDCMDILQYSLFEYNVFEDETQDVVIAFLRTVLNQHKKAELYVYILQLGFCLASLRIVKPKRIVSSNSIGSDVETKNLANFHFMDVEVKRMSTQRRQALYNDLKADLSTIFNFINPYVDYILGLENTNSAAFHFTKINESSFVYFMKTNNSFSELINYILKTILPLVTTHLTS